MGFASYLKLPVLAVGSVGRVGPVHYLHFIPRSSMNMCFWHFLAPKTAQTCINKAFMDGTGSAFHFTALQCEATTSTS